MWDSIKRYWRGLRRWAFGASPSDEELSAMVGRVIDRANMEMIDKTKPKKTKKAGPHCCVVTFNDNGESWCFSSVPDDDLCQATRDEAQRSELKRTGKPRNASYAFFKDTACKPRDCERLIK